ncbi:hypothetical protein [Synechococcus elongatus]|uniref:Uncharacterized protein n=2 Tax=Synechococcus elongatus TaxID=32046 RepID=Q31P42_SYNE7|nr:hypothetical protein [Synechococcus elongatus]ABB57177.1 conserved hypothetical protein [Synechococcus elongatus PCC 7942 = FACHB-805]AJD58309.1 hypothetical protein M744_10920 [Synechococcus elongatus UTEX 2973]MBD2587581.1 hypothetical protein [Synechococcus elongatus FACHB-242]MBD2688640.1 hypothetical protein [Synechococcus elongatus FACHB-1061]MBD2707711.1 hypothetical protein [Synechococcus elongatus PCC 7942 = FACHB-805]
MVSCPGFNLPKNPRRRDLVQLAQAWGWTIEPAGYEQLKATRPGWSSVSITGHHDHKPIPKGTANKIYRQLLRPLLEPSAATPDLQTQVAVLAQQLEAAGQERDEWAAQCQHYRQVVEQADLDQEAAEQLLLEIEQRNHRLVSERHWLSKRLRKLGSQLQKAQRQARVALEQLRWLHGQNQLLQADLKMSVASIEQVEAIALRAQALRSQGAPSDQCLAQLLGQLHQVLGLSEPQA